MHIPKTLSLSLSLSHTHTLTHTQKLSPTQEKMVRVFKAAPNSLSDKLMPKRNWCYVANAPSSAGGDMQFTLRVEPQGPEPDKPVFEAYSITAPLLNVVKGEKGDKKGVASS